MLNRGEWICWIKVFVFFLLSLVFLLRSVLVQVKGDNILALVYEYSPMPVLVNGISVDKLGNHKVYNNKYRHIIQQVERIDRGVLLKVSKQLDEIEDIGRLRRKQMNIVKKRRKSTLVIVDKKVWDIRKCEKRVKSNQSDGDARLILGGYYLMEGEFLKAAVLFQNPESAKYNTFHINNMYEWLGYAYYELGRLAKEKRDIEDAIEYLKKEQQVYLSAYKYKNKSKSYYYFRYLYSLTFIDLGLCLEKTERSGGMTGVELPELIKIDGSRQAYENALKVLIDIDKSISKIHESRAYVYEKLGRLDKAAEERKLQGMTFKASIYKKKRKPIREMIIKELEKNSLLTVHFKIPYMNWLESKYKIKNYKAQKVLDSLVMGLSKEITRKKMKEHSEIMTLTRENRKLLYIEIKGIIKKRIRDSLNVLEITYIWNIIKNLVNKKNYTKALRQIEKHGKLLEMSAKSDELFKLKNEIKNKLKKIKQRKIKQREIKQKEIKQISLDKDSKKKKVKMDTLLVYTKDVAKKDEEGEMPLYKSVGMMIDNLVEKKDFVGAYRGVKAYEKVLKTNFGGKKIDKTTKDLEMLIESEFGKKYLKNLKKELKK